MYSSGMPCDTEVGDEEIPSIYVNQDLLPSVQSSRKSSCSLNDEPGCDKTVDTFKEYCRNSKLLGDEDGTFEESDGTGNLRQFEVYSSVSMEEHPGGVDTSVDDDRHLELCTEVVPQGVILNSNVYLNIQQWNTLVYVSEATFYCAVCAVYCDEKEHIKLDSHNEKLSKHKPLYKYDLSIVRKIINYLHCGVCNVLFNESQNDEHFSSKDHEDKMLFALNKVSDIMYDSNIHNDKTDTYHFSAKAINNNNNVDLTSSEDDDHDSNYNDYGNSYGDLKYIENDEAEEDDDDFYDNVEPSLSLEHSYASMARRPKTNELPKVLEIDIGNKKITVNYNSWNMVISPKPNRYYCMVCTQFGHIRVQAEHCRTLEHVERLARCKIVDAYDMHLVRQVDGKFYHCGHCNNLQLIHEMVDHIETQHPNRHTNTDSPAKPSTPLKANSKNKLAIYNDKENCKNGVNNSSMKKLNFDNHVANGTHQASNNNEPHKISQSIGSGNLNMYKDMLLVNSNLYDDIVICAYGKAIRISKMAYNILCARENDFYCGLCEVMVEKEFIKEHVNNLQHLILLERTPFIEAFNIHLFRQIREALHCALCNVLIQLIPAMISSHKFEPKHAQRVLEAVDQIPKEGAPPASIKDTKPISNANKTVKVATENVKDVKLEATAAKEMDKNVESEAALNIDNIVSDEFVQVKNGARESDVEDSDDDDSVKDEFDSDEHVYVKLGNAFSKITNTAYNTLVPVGDGTRYCFVCSSAVERQLKKHVDSRGHVENIDKYKFVEKYKEDLLRQIYLTYHCSICNVLVMRKQLNQHLGWPTHSIQAENIRISGKQRKTDIKSGMKQYNISTVKENIYLNEKESKVKIHLNVAMQKENVVDVVRKNKIIIFNDNVLKISFDAWHSLSEVPKGWKCKMCQSEFGGMELGNHIASDWHNGSLEKFDLKCSPALIRKINDTTLNCVMCNTEVSNKKHIIQEHVHGKKHKKSLDAILEESSVANTYADCDENVLTL